MTIDPVTVGLVILTGYTALRAMKAIGRYQDAREHQSHGQRIDPKEASRRVGERVHAHQAQKEEKGANNT